MRYCDQSKFDGPYKFTLRPGSKLRVKNVVCSISKRQRNGWLTNPSGGFHFFFVLEHYRRQGELELIKF